MNKGIWVVVVLLGAIPVLSQEYAGFSLGSSVSISWASLGESALKTHTDALVGGQFAASGYFPLGKHQVEAGLGFSMEGYRYRLGEFFGQRPANARMRLGYGQIKAVYQWWLQPPKRNRRYRWRPSLHTGLYYNIKAYSRWTHPDGTEIWNADDIAFAQGGLVLGLGAIKNFRRPRNRAISIQVHYNLGIEDMLNFPLQKGYARILAVGLRYYWLRKT